MLYENIYSDIIKQFDSLWQFKERGKTLEIISPIATTNDKFVSVFLTKRGKQYIVSDSGWVNNSNYGIEPPYEDACFEKIYNHFIKSFDIEETQGINNNTVYYKKTENENMIPSVIFDMAHFVSSIVSTSNVNFLDKKETDVKERFKRTANNYIKNIVPEKNVTFWSPISRAASLKNVKLNAIVRKQSRLTLINYVTGSTDFYFTNSISKSNMVFEVVTDARNKPQIDNKIAVIDDNASGYVIDKIGTYLTHLAKQNKVIKWSERQSLDAILN
jgi:hypothetical protein